ncbi:MAG: hypothetical protein ABI472_04410 [Ginsengibacter sp.]
MITKYNTKLFFPITAVLVACLFSPAVSKAQVPNLTPAQKLITLSGEDSLAQGIAKSKTILSGYGSAYYQHDQNAQKAFMTLERFVFFIGHQFNNKIAFFSETEIENAKVEGGVPGGEIALEQAFVRFKLNSRQYLVAGLFTPRIGILNENHLPVNFNGVERPMVEQLVIPATWRELGIGFYGELRRLPVNYSMAIVNGLNAAAFVHGSGIREGRAEGNFAPANNLAITASLQYFYKDFKFQVSGYAGGTTPFGKREADSLQLESSFFGAPVYLTEANAQYAKNGFNTKAIVTYISYPQAAVTNKAFASNVPAGIDGGYIEVGYNVFEHTKSEKLQSQTLNAFARYEMLDLNQSIPDNGIYDGTEKQNHLVIGLGYLPIPNVVIKADVRLLHTGMLNPELVVNPNPVALPYRQNNTFINLGIGWSF